MAEVPQTQVGEVVEALARALELHDYRRGLFAETESHAVRVTRLALQLAEQVAPDLAADPRLEYGFRLHDIGMIGVSNEILSKPGRLSRDELAEVREHPLLGERIVAPIGFLNGVARQVIGAHHERWDGSGYPRGLKGEAIPIEGRVVAVADVFDALTTKRPYKEAMPLLAARQYLSDKKGREFDPACVDAFLSRWDEVVAIAESVNARRVAAEMPAQPSRVIEAVAPSRDEATSPA
jgi:putative two-component system response regulator